MSKRFRFLPAACLVIFAPPAVRAQFSQAAITGQVSDPARAVVPQAKVTAINNGTNVQYSTETSGAGVYLIPSLPPGNYRVQVEKVGFRTIIKPDVVLHVQDRVALNFEMGMGSVAETVTVAAHASVLPTETATVSRLIDEKAILELPLEGRLAQQLLFLAPGAVDMTVLYCPQGGCQGGMYGRNTSMSTGQVASVNGGGTQNVVYLMDGANHNDTYVNMNLPFPNPDAIQEFSAQTNNMSAEYGHGTAVVDIVTKSGTNAFHGAAFEFVRNARFNARNFFAAVPSPLKRNQFGGTLGGPIEKNRLFFFGTYQGTRMSSAPAAASAFVPTAAQRGGDFSALAAQLIDPLTRAAFSENRIPASRFSPPALFFIERIPLPNGPNGRLTYLGSTALVRDDQFMPKIDWTRGKSRLSGRYFFSQITAPPADLAQVNANLLAMKFGTRARVQTVAANYTYSASPTVLFNTWFGWCSLIGQNLANAPFGYPDAGINLPRATGGPQLEIFSVAGFFSFEGKNNGASNRGDKTIREVAMIQKGTHGLSFGGQAMRPNLNIAIPLNQGGTFTFSNALTRSNLADFLLGQGVNFSQQAGQYVNLIGTAYSLFAQDNWRVTQKLTLNLGIRWDPYWPYKESHNAIACYVPGAKSQRYPNAPAGVIYGGDPGCPSGAGSYPNPANFAPRLGFAYRLGGQTVLRGGVGLYYQLPQGSTYNLVTQTAPFSPSVTLTGTCLADPYGCAGAANPFPANFGLVVPGASATFSATPSNVSQSASIRGRIPALGTWNLMLQREVAHHWLLSAAYVGTSGWRLFSTQVGHLNANPAVYVPGASTVANTQSRRLNPSVGVARVFTAHNSSYNSMQLEARKRFSRGFSLWANYTWSHTLDNFPAPRGQNTVHMDSFDRGRDWGNSLENVPNVLHVSGVWEIPAPVRGSLRLLAGGWQLAPILTWQNGLPFTVLSGVDNSRSGNGFDRAEFLGRSLREAVLGDRPHGEMAARFFDTSLFAANALGTFGNTGKNILQGPGLFQINLGLAKDVNLTENTAVQFRAEFSNALNNVNFSAPNSTVNSAAFGQITAAAGERVLQFGLKVRF